MLKKIPYGISNFRELIDLNMYYNDKTKYIQMLEDKVRHQFFIRPRRFGKSLFLTMLETYYDINEKDNFDKYFGQYYIGKNKTAEASKYLVLKMSFATVISDMGKDKLVESFDKVVATNIGFTIGRYSKILSAKGLPDGTTTATYALDYICSLARKNSIKIVLLIDEYDNFANNLMTNNKTLYQDLLHGDGYVRTFYKAIKEGTADGVITRTFVTGVSPIMLGDITSGANIFEIISNDEDLNAMMGFTDSELSDILNYYQIEKKVDKTLLMPVLRNYCNGYKFSKETVDTVYNTDMILYLLNKIISTNKLPDKLIDENVKTDYSRLRRIAEFFVSKDELNEIIETGTASAVEIKDRFSLESLFHEVDREASLKSLLYYMGMLTIDKAIENATILRIPNYAIKQLYWEYVHKTYQIDNSVRYEHLKSAMMKMRIDGTIDDLITIYQNVINQLSTRDLTHFNEASCKCIFITLVHTDGIYLIESERQASGGYSDLYLKEGYLFQEYVKYRYMFEFKYIKNTELSGDVLTMSKDEICSKNASLIASYKDAAKVQLEQYMTDYNVLNDSDRILKKFTVVVIGRKYVEVDEV